MSTRSVFAGLLIAAALVVIGGCHEYHVEVELADDRSGSRIVNLETDQSLTPETRQLLAIEGDGWAKTTSVDHEGKEDWRYRSARKIADLDGWRDAGGTILRADMDGEIRLASDVQVEEVSGTEGKRLVYRETLFWTGVTEEVAEIVATDYAAFLRREFPDLPDSLVHESRGAMAATVIMNWAELTDSEPGDDPEAELGERFNQMLALRLLRAGVAPALTQRIVRQTADWGYFDGVEAALPGLDHCFQSTLFLTVTMPTPITGGNADLVEGRVAKFRVELSSTLPKPLTLEVSCKP